MLDRASAEALLVNHLATVDRAVAAISRRHGVSPSDTEEAAGWVRLRLVEDDYALVRKFRGDASFPTYLAVIVASLLRDYRMREWGRWRPSAEAQRQGPLAVALETLVHRDRRPFAEAAETVRSQGLTRDDDRTLAALLATLPTREPLRPTNVDPSAIDAHAADASADAAVLREETTAERTATREMIAGVVAELDPEARVVVTLRFWERMSIADIARHLGVEQKPLYRRLEKTLIELEQRLRARGIDASHIGQLADEGAG